MHMEEMTRGVDKLARYGWKVVDGRGTFQEIDKRLLKVDHRYQRDLNPDKVAKIRANWSWIACGVLVVARREDGSIHIIEGQHRGGAAMGRSDITTLPCIVFEVRSVQEEALGFWRANCDRKPVTAIEKHKSATTYGDHASQVVDRVLSNLGLEISKSATRAGQIKCIAVCRRLALDDEAAFEEVMTLAAAMCAKENSPIPERLVQGLYYLHKNTLDYGDGLKDRRLRSRLMEKGAHAMVLAAGRAAAYYSRGGAKVFASGMMAELNKGLHNKFQMVGLEA